MVTFEIIPHVGVGPVQFGMKADELDAALGKPERVHGNRYDYLSGFMVDLDESGRVVFIELADSPNFQATYRGVNLHHTAAQDAVTFISQFDTHDADDPEVGYSYVFKKLQLSLWRGTVPEDEADEDGKYFEAVGVGTDGYFE